MNEQPHPFVALIDLDGVIYQYNANRKGPAVGVDLQREGELLKQIDDMQEVIEKYRDKLVENGIITLPKSPEEIAREAAEAQLAEMRKQNEQNAKIQAQMLETMKSLQAEITALKTAQGAPETKPPIKQKGGTNNA